jgi:hypothetical protein
MRGPPLARAFGAFGPLTFRYWGSDGPPGASHWGPVGLPEVRHRGPFSAIGGHFTSKWAPIINTVWRCPLDPFSATLYIHHM